VADAYSGISNGTLSVKADFTLNGVAPNSELVDQGTFTSPGIFAIPLNRPITNLPISHLTATVLDSQGNRTTVKVRFWVAPPDFRVLSLDAAGQDEGRFDLRFENPDALTTHTILWNDNVSAPSSAWLRLPLLEWEAESNRIRRVEVQVPSGPSSGFLRVRQP
jgi:hypothetical protein